MEKNAEEKKHVPMHMRLFNAAFRIPFISFKMKERLAYSFLPEEKAKDLKKLTRQIGGGMNAQYGAYDALKEFAPNYAKWQTEEELKKIPAGSLIASGAALAILDYWTAQDVDLFFAKYITTAQEHEAFCKAVYRVSYHLKHWGYITEDDKPRKLSEEEHAEMIENVWGGMAHFLADDMPEPKRSKEEWIPILKPFFIKP